jgi:hypothetical protein
MYRLFVLQIREALGKGEEAYSKESATEPLTKRIADLRTNPSGSGIHAASRRCGLGHRTVYASSAAPQFAARIIAAIGAASASEIP